MHHKLERALKKSSVWCESTKLFEDPSYREHDTEPLLWDFRVVEHFTRHTHACTSLIQPGFIEFIVFIYYANKKSTTQQMLINAWQIMWAQIRCMDWMRYVFVFLSFIAFANSFLSFIVSGSISHSSRPYPAFSPLLVYVRYVQAHRVFGDPHSKTAKDRKVCMFSPVK